VIECIDTVHALQARADAERAAGHRIALVPTMGALHAGHASLFKVARQRADRVWVSIFVNPTQFDDPRDLAAYPRTLEADLAICRDAGVELVFAPDPAEMYPAGAQTFVEVGELAAPLCGASRPGHFRGVATVVTKLLLAAKPHVAVFGEKDFQQLAVIRQLVRDLPLDVEIVGAPTVREPDGLALSSRNRHLDGDARRQAVALVRALDAAEAAVAAGECDSARVLALARAELAAAPRAEIDYAELRDPITLAPAPVRLTGPALLALAVFMRPMQVARSEPKASEDQQSGREGKTVRLIDNRVLQPKQTRGEGVRS
jgi:pantoate--beta-alanine ligase